MATRPKGYLPKGKTKSFDAVRKANARKDLTTLKGIGGIVGNAILNSPGGRAIKVGKAANKIVKGITTGKQKAINKANYKIDGTRRTEGVGAIVVTKSGKLREFMSNAPVKGATRKVNDNAQRAEKEAKGYTKRQSIGKYPSKKLIRDIKNEAYPKSKVPVKKKAK
jgi:hypothetical protein